MIITSAIDGRIVTTHIRCGRCDEPLTELPVAGCRNSRDTHRHGRCRNCGGTIVCVHPPTIVAVRP